MGVRLTSSLSCLPTNCCLPSSSLGDLYDANVGLIPSIGWRWSGYSLMMALLGAFLACAWPLVRLPNLNLFVLSSRLSFDALCGYEIYLASIDWLWLLSRCCSRLSSATNARVKLAIIALVMLVSVALFTPFLMWKLFNETSCPFTRWSSCSLVLRWAHQ
ncbi:hypothetical protein O9993_16430 [Vibrio lentus]|nr:hypothetical protein [Vibrio lentus]